MFTRRELVKAATFAGVAAGIPLHRWVNAAVDPYPNRMPTSLLPAPFTRPFQQPATLAPVRSDATTDYFRLNMTAITGEIVPGYQTPLYAYNGSVPGATIRATRGRRAVVRLVNQLPAYDPQFGYRQWTSLHLHGSPSAPQYDGYASDTTMPGTYKDYIYENTTTARTLWYHDHGAHHTSLNVYQGLFGMYILTDPAEASLGLPTGEFDVPLIINDAMLQADGRLLYSLADNNGSYGDIICVNGQAWPLMKVKRRKYRFRLLNASMSRSFSLQLSSGDQLQVISTDGGLMPAPQNTKSLRIGMAERYDVVVDFAKFAPGTRIVLRNSNPKNNTSFANTDKVMAFDVVGDSFDPANNTVPAVLNPSHPAMQVTPAQATVTRTWSLDREGGQFVINGTTWRQIANSGYTLVSAKPELGSTEIWEVKNLHGGWFHPFHVHLVDFQILSRNGNPPPNYERGPKDVVYIAENETVRLLMRFDRPGKYMVHCHNLAHEDDDMMTQYEVVQGGASVGPSPLSAPGVPLPEGPL